MKESRRTSIRRSRAVRFKRAAWMSMCCIFMLMALALAAAGLVSGPGAKFPRDSKNPEILLVEWGEPFVVHGDRAELGHSELMWRYPRTSEPEIFRRTALSLSGWRVLFETQERRVSWNAKQPSGLTGGAWPLQFDVLGVRHYRSRTFRQFEIESDALCNEFDMNLYSAPSWYFVGLFALCSAWIFWRLRRTRPPRPMECDACHYDLTGNTSGICPECGRALDPALGHQLVGAFDSAQPRQRRQILAHGVSRGCQTHDAKAPEGRKKSELERWPPLTEDRIGTRDYCRVQIMIDPSKTRRRPMIARLRRPIMLLFCGLCVLAAAGLTWAAFTSLRKTPNWVENAIVEGPLPGEILLFEWEPDEFEEHVPEEKIGGDVQSTTSRGKGPAVAPQIFASVRGGRFAVHIERRRYWRDPRLACFDTGCSSQRHQAFGMRHQSNSGSRRFRETDDTWYIAYHEGFSTSAWYLIIILLLPPTVVLTRRLIRRRRRPDTACTSCNYDLTGNVSGICPECGRALDSKDSMTPSL